MAPSKEPNITWPTPEYSLYHYNSLSQTAAADNIGNNIVQAKN